MTPCAGDCWQPVGKARKQWCGSCAKWDSNGGKCMGEMGMWQEVEDAK